MRTALNLALCLASGFLLALAYPRPGLWPLAWVALIPWLVVVFTANRSTAIAGSWLAGFAFFGALMYWIAIFGYLPWALVAAIEGLAFVLTAVIVRFIAPASPWRVAAVGVTWVAWEFLRAQGQFGVPWGQVGHSQAPFLALSQLAAFGGVPAISFVVVTANAAIAHALATRRNPRPAFTPLVCAIALALGAVGLGAVRARADTRPGVPVAVVQGSVKTWLTVDALNVPLTAQEQLAELAVYARLTRQAAARGARVIIWPESALPGYLQYDSLVSDEVLPLARELEVWLVVGGPSFEGRRQHNSIYVISPLGAITGRYDKVHLVPFGEYVPGRKWLPLLSHYRVREVDVSRGRGHHLLRADGLGWGPMICFESVFPEISQRDARLGADALVIITNDAWFLRTAAAAQHLQIGRFRAIEQGLYVARAASTGISCFIDPLGRVTQSLGLYQRGVLVAPIPARQAKTVYQRVGPAFSLACVGITVLWMLGAAAAARTRRSR